MLRTVPLVVLVVLLLSVVSLSAAELQFDETGVTATVTPHATTYWTCGCLGTFSSAPLIGLFVEIIADTDGDGQVRWEQGDRWTHGLWTMIDGSSGTITAGTRNGATPEPLGFPPKALLRDEHGVYSRFALTSQDPFPHRDGVHLIWVRPGVGAWRAVVFDHALYDEIEVGLKVMVELADLSPVGESPAAPQGVVEGDFLILTDYYARHWTGDRVDPHLTESLGPGVIDFASVRGHEEVGKIEIRLVRTEGTDGAASVHYATEDGTARAGEHYLASSGTVVFDPGQIFQTFEIPLIDDEIDAQSPQFRVTLSEPSGAALGSPSLDITIPDDDGPPMVSLPRQLVLQEGSGGPREVLVPVSLSHSAPKPVTLEWRAYDRLFLTTHETGVVEIPIGANEGSIPIHYVADDTYGFDQRYRIELTKTTNAVAINYCDLRILEDDPKPVMTLEGAEVSERDSSAVVTFVLSAPLTFDFTATYQTVDRSASAVDDFVHVSGEIHLPAGGTSATIDIPIRDDDVPEGTEWFEVEVQAVIGDEPLTARVTILDDDVPRRRVVRH